MSNTLDDMLDDAKILADYGWRSGQLKDARLFEAIAAFENLGSRTWKAPETANLQDALNEAVVSIAPTTLSDIKRRNPFAASTRPETVKRIALIAFSILLMVLTARFTILYNTGVELAAQLDEINEARPAEKMAAVARQWLSAKDEAGTNETYYRMLDELRELDSQVRAYSAGYAEYREAVRWWTPWNYLFQQPFPQAPPMVSGDGAANAGNYPQVSCGMIPLGATIIVPSPDDFAGKPPGSILNRNKELIANFACTEALAITPYSMPVLVAGGADIRNILKVLGLWLLPAFYGALGATISYMRAILNPVLPDPPMERIVHRIALGGFAGIIFAWFWAPSADASQDFVGLTINSFAVAFIIGFSIDVLFALLDTLVRFLQNVVNQIGQAGAPAQAAVGARGGPTRPAPVPLPAAAPSPVIRGLAPAAVPRAATPVVLTLTGDGLANVQSIVVANGEIAIEATDIEVTDRSVAFSVLLDPGQPAGDWSIAVTDATGAAIAVPGPLTVT